ncbi:hypothetical protein Bhyg_02611 [Pseudolycoriella hygida]|uniref:Uncharacterized protein n=1 Tax=Pseudolycoriella hygida TaxID=35572 RepID=A0A9Q0NDK8_9DIPT|nr:hypothetical protein Bhyg_02611 [Pseudolycoriella hygida]
MAKKVSEPQEVNGTWPVIISWLITIDWFKILRRAFPSLAPFLPSPRTTEAVTMDSTSPQVRMPTESPVSRNVINNRGSVAIGRIVEGNVEINTEIIQPTTSASQRHQSNEIPAHVNNLINTDGSVGLRHEYRTLQGP